MEEKERYMWIDRETTFDSDKLYDKTTGIKYDPVYATDLLNYQDKRIKELEKTNKVLSNELTKNSILNQDYIETCCGIPIFEIPKIKEENQQLKQSQKQLAIEELKLALENFRNRPTHFDVARQELCLSDQDKQFIDFINNRIKELDGGKNDHK